ncbi:anti-sigma factor [Streptomyces sp. NPDC051776]|uniref:anti-sigma factor n=1 Tax=Streptomyces sp. NPDC051776 TaxID=3155414 RepID=UPI003423E20D
MNAPDLHLLTGAYAMDALPEGERAEFERHLAECPSCDQEVRELTSTAARLGLAVSLVPPPGMKDRVMTGAAAVRQEPPRIPGRQQMPSPPQSPAQSWSGGHGRRRTRPAPRYALAACLAAAAVLGGTVAVVQYGDAREARQIAQDARKEAREKTRQTRDSERRTEELARVLAAPDASAGTGRLKSGGTVTVVVSREEDKAAFLMGHMPKPPSGKVYQLWFDDHGSMRPAGLLDASKDTAATLLHGSVGGATGMGITLEPAGGSKQPTTEPLALMDLPPARRT